jgi:hypothetical protein
MFVHGELLYCPHFRIFDLPNLEKKPPKAAAFQQIAKGKGYSPSHCAAHPKGAVFSVVQLFGKLTP